MLIVPEAGKSKMMALADSTSAEGPLSGSFQLLFIVSSLGGRSQAVWILFLRKSTNPIDKGSTLTT